MPNLNISLLPARHARYRGDHLAFVFGETRLTYKELNARINRIANVFVELGINKGDKIATILPNSVELVEVYWAVAKIGAVVVPLSPLLRAHALVTLLTDSDTTTVITTASMVDQIDEARQSLPAIAADRYILIDSQDYPGYRYYHDLTADSSEVEPPYVEIEDDDLYNIIYSSGTTGLPKGIIHTHYIRANYCSIFASVYRMQPESVICHAGSLVFNGAFLTFMPWMYLGATYILMPSADPVKLIETIEREKVTHIKMVPSQIISMLHAPNFAPEKLKSLQMLGSVGAPLHHEHKMEIHTKLPGIFYELYGLTEGFMSILDREDFPRKMDSVGCASAFMELRMLNENGHECLTREVGEICGRSPMLMPGYYKRPDLTAQAIVNGWMHSGDMGYFDEDGFLYLVDRKKDMIISGGVNVYPRDIEEILVKHPAIREVAVFGVPSEKWGETPVAAIVLKQAGSAAPDEIKQWVNECVEARYQQVSEVIIVDEFPRNVAGKTLKRVMRDQYWQNNESKL